MKTHEIPCIVMSRLSLRNLVMRFRLDSVDQVGEFDGMLDEKDGDVVSNYKLWC